MKKFNLVYEEATLNKKPLTESEALDLQSEYIRNYGYRAELQEIR